MELMKLFKPSQQYIQNLWHFFALPVTFILIFIFTNVFFTPIASGKEKVVIRVGAYENNPKIYTSTDGNVSGFWPDLIAYIANKENWDVKYIHGNWNECLERLSSGKIDIMPDVAFTEKRDKIYAFSKHSVLVSWARIYVKKGYTGIESIIDLKNKKIAVLKGSTNYEGSGGIKKIVHNFNINCTFVEFNSYNKVFEAIKNNLVDAGVTNRNFGNKNEKNFNVKKTGVVFYPIDIKFAFTKNSSLSQYCSGKIDYHMGEFLKDTNSFYYLLLEKHFETKIAEKTVEVFPTWLRTVLKSIGILFLCLFLVIFLSRIQVRRKTDEIKIKNEALRKSEERLRAILKANPDPVIVYDDSGHPLYLNSSFTEVFGWCLDELQGKQIPFVPEDQKQVTSLKIKEIFKSGNPVRFVTKRLSKNGKVIDVLLSAAITKNIQETKNGIVVNLTDISEQKRLEEQLRQSQKMEAIGTLAGGIAHDFNNILSGIFGYAQLTEIDPTDPDKVKKNIKQIVKGAQRASELVQQILAFSRQTEYKKNILNLSLIVKEAVKFLHSSIPASIVIEENILSRAMVLADHTQVHQVVMNLCTNAYHAMSDSGGTLSVELGNIKIKPQNHPTPNSSMPGNYAKLEIKDTGCGIDEKNLEKIFNPYFTTKEIGKGTGMGLAVVDGIVKKHGGFIKAYSKIGLGSTIQVFWPVIEKENLDNFSEKKELIWPKGKEQIMLVDDETDIILITQEILEKQGYKVTTFKDGLSALKAFNKDPDFFELIITDMTMPRMKGDELSIEILKLKKNIPIILCTGFSEAMSEEKAVSLGIKSLVLKPIVLNDFVNKIREVLDH